MATQMPQRADMERSVYRRIFGLLRDWLEKVRQAVMRSWRVWRTYPDPQAVYEVPWTPIVTEILEVVEPAHQIGWDETMGTLGLNLPYTSTNTFVQAQVAHTQNLLVQIPDRVAELVFAQISDAINEGIPMDEIAERVDDVLRMSGSRNWPHRAQVIAQTESNRAANSGALAAGMLAQQFEGIPMVKEWLTSDDTRVREVHEEVDNLRVPVDQPFPVGQSFLMYPGDPVGAPSDIIACRCSLLVKVARRGD